MLLILLAERLRLWIWGGWVMRYEENKTKKNKTQIANQHGTKNSNCHGTDILGYTKRKTPYQRTMNIKLSSWINREQKTKWSKNGGMENPIQGLKAGYTVVPESLHTPWHFPIECHSKQVVQNTVFWKQKCIKVFKVWC